MFKKILLQTYKKIDGRHLLASSVALESSFDHGGIDFNTTTVGELKERFLVQQNSKVNTKSSIPILGSSDICLLFDGKELRKDSQYLIDAVPAAASFEHANFFYDVMGLGELSTVSFSVYIDRKLPFSQKSSTKTTHLTEQQSLPSITTSEKEHKTPPLEQLVSSFEQPIERSITVQLHDSSGCEEKKEITVSIASDATIGVLKQEIAARILSAYFRDSDKTLEMKPRIVSAIQIPSIEHESEQDSLLVSRIPQDVPCAVTITKPNILWIKVIDADAQGASNGSARYYSPSIFWKDVKTEMRVQDSLENFEENNALDEVETVLSYLLRSNNQGIEAEVLQMPPPQSSSIAGRMRVPDSSSNFSQKNNAQGSPGTISVICTIGEQKKTVYMSSTSTIGEVQAALAKKIDNDACIRGLSAVNNSSSGDRKYLNKDCVISSFGNESGVVHFVAVLESQGTLELRRAFSSNDIPLLQGTENKGIGTDRELSWRSKTPWILLVAAMSWVSVAVVSVLSVTMTMLAWEIILIATLFAVLATGYATLQPDCQWRQQNTGWKAFLIGVGVFPGLGALYGSAVLLDVGVFKLNLLPQLGSTSVSAVLQLGLGVFIVIAAVFMVGFMAYKTYSRGKRMCLDKDEILIDGRQSIRHDRCKNSCDFDDKHPGSFKKCSEQEISTTSVFLHYNHIL